MAVEQHLGWEEGCSFQGQGLIKIRKCKWYWAIELLSGLPIPWSMIAPGPPSGPMSSQNIRQGAPKRIGRTVVEPSSLVVVYNVFSVTPSTDSVMSAETVAGSGVMTAKAVVVGSGAVVVLGTPVVEMTVSVETAVVEASEEPGVETPGVEMPGVEMLGVERESVETSLPVDVSLSVEIPGSVLTTSEGVVDSVSLLYGT